MCSSCDTIIACTCNGGDVFYVCPVSKGVDCPICKHSAPIFKDGKSEVAKGVLVELLRKEVYLQDPEYLKFNK